MATILSKTNANIKTLTGSVVKAGYSPYIDEDTGTWWEYDVKTKSFIDTGVSATGIQGEKGEAGQDGAQGPAGETGPAGADGTSVIITNIDQSLYDNGTSTVTFSDGNVLYVKNGSKGSDGAAGKDGATGEQGPKGDKGEKGDTGDPVKVLDTVETDVDGAVNKVIFSDGTELGIRNGNTGSQGPRGEKGEAGDDYIIKAEDYTAIAKEVSEGLQPTITDLDTDKMDKVNPTGSGSVSIGRKATGYPIGSNSVAMGYNAIADGTYAVAIGNTARASGESSAAFNIGKASGPYAHAEGMSTASGYAAHAEGRLGNTASGDASHVEGEYNTASGYASHAEGLGTIASARAQHVEGKYNDKLELDRYLHVVGNGTSNSDRSNAHTLDSDGIGWFAGDVRCQGASAYDDPAISLAADHDSINDLYTQLYDANENIQQNAENIIELNTLASDTNTKISTINNTDAYQQREIEYLKKVNEGQTYDIETVNETVYEADVPSGAVAVSVDEIGGKSIVFNQKITNEYINGTIDYPANQNTYVEKLTANSGAIADLAQAYHMYYFAETIQSEYAYSVRIISRNSDDEYFEDSTYYGSVGDFTTAKRISKVFNAYPKANGKYFYIRIYCNNTSSEVHTLTYSNAMLFDLTTLFGSGNEPTDATTARTRLLEECGIDVDTYYPYSENTLKHSVPKSAEVHGKNLIDLPDMEDTMVNILNKSTTDITNLKDGETYTLSAYCEVNPNTTRIYVAVRDFSEKIIVAGTNIYSGNSGISTLTFTKTTEMATIEISYGSGGDYISKVSNIQLEKADAATTYSPYKDETIPLPASLTSFLADKGFGWGINDDVKNYIDLENKKYVQMVGSVDLGTLSWTYDQATPRFYTLDINTLVKTSTINVKTILPYKACAYNYLAGHDKTLCIFSTGSLSIRDDSYTDISTFKSAMSGVTLLYELKTPIEYDISSYLEDYFLEALSCEAGGTITYHNEVEEEGILLPSVVTEEYIIKTGEA